MVYLSHMLSDKGMSFSGGHSQGSLSKKDIGIVQKNLRSTLKKGEYENPASWVLFPRDRGLLEEAERVVALARPKTPQYVILIGIGGSTLGAQAMISIAQLDKKSPSYFFLDTVDDKSYRDLEEIIQHIESPDDICFVVVSPSGSTLETTTNKAVADELFEKRFGESCASRTIVVTKKESELWKYAEEESSPVVLLPSSTVSRFGALGPMGIVPLLCGGHDIRALYRGACAVLDTIKEDDMSDAWFARSASHILSHIKKGNTIISLFMFPKILEAFAMWYRQILSESLSKEVGDVRIGVTPIVSLGSNDLHVMAPRYFDGPRDILTHLFWASQEDVSDSLSHSRGVLARLYQAAKDTYVEKELPFIELRMDALSVEAMGSLMQGKMIETMLIAQALGIDPFTQPGVDTYKKRLHT